MTPRHVVRALGALCLFASIALALPRVAQAQTHAGKSATNYDDVIAQAVQEFSAGDWSEAYALFAQAHTLRPNARTLRGMGAAAYEMRDYPRSIGHLRAALAEKEKPLTEAQQKDVEATLARALRLVGTLQLSLQPVDARVFINGMPRKERELLLAVGEAKLRVEAERYEPIERRLHIEGGATEQLTIQLRPVAPTALETARAGLASDRTRNDDRSASRHGRSVWSSPWLWAGVGGVVVAGVVTAVLLSAHRHSADDVPSGTLGTSAHALWQ